MAFLVLPASLLTPLQAVNMAIKSIGESEVTTLTPPPHVDVETALSYLNEVDLEVQSRGWAWNRETDFPLSLDGDSKAPLPDLTLRATRGASESTYTQIIQRGGLMYDRERHSYTFEAAPKVDLIVRLDWDSIPQAARSYIALEATQRFQATKQASQIVLQVNAADKNRAYTVMEQQEDEDAGNNTVYSTAVQAALSGAGGLRRNRTGLL